MEKDPAAVQVSCKSNDFESIRIELQKISGVESVGRLMEKGEKLCTVFVKFESEEAAVGRMDALKGVPGLVFPNDASLKGPFERQTKKNKKKIDVSDHYLKVSTYEEIQREKDVHQRKDRHRSDQEGRGRGVRGGNFGRGGLGRLLNRHDKFHGKQTEGTQNFRRSRRPFYNAPPLQFNVATVDNVPFNMTNHQIASKFNEYGMVLDIFRWEKLAMITYDTAEAVQRAIFGMNGKFIRDDALVSVSSGVVRLPPKKVFLPNQAPIQMPNQTPNAPML